MSLPEPIIERGIPGPYHFRDDMSSILEEYNTGTFSLDQTVHRLMEVVEEARSLNCEKCTAPGLPYVLCHDCIAKERECESCKEEAQYCSVQCARENEY